MELKKNPKKDLNKNSSFYFVFGLVLVMLLAFMALEWKTYEKPNTFIVELDKVDELLDDEHVEKFEIEKPKIKQVLPPEIKIEENDVEIIETKILSTEVDTDTKIMEVDDIIVDDIEEVVKVNWITIEEVPIFPGCENEEDKRGCFNKMMQKHIKKYFRYPETAQEMGLQGRVSTQFVIHKDGSIGTIQKRGPYQLLEDEAERILKKLPKMTPGKQRGTAVKVPFAIQITFRLQ